LKSEEISKKEKISRNQESEETATSKEQISEIVAHK
jgi:hypothetical protein